MDVLRTPDERFDNLPGFDFEPNYVDIDGGGAGGVDGGGLRMHYVDIGPRDAAPVLLLHGEPTWSYLYRWMIPPLQAAGHRVVAPDLIGFGRSDKPARIDDYSYASHVAWMAAFLDALDLRGITLFCQDWGSLIGLRLVAECGNRFARVILSNGGLPAGDIALPRAFYLWRAFARHSPWFPIGRIVSAGCVRTLTPAERRAYDAPFPSARYKAGTRAFPRLVPATPADPAVADNLAAWRALREWRKPFLTAFSSRDPITRGGERLFVDSVPGCQGQPHEIVHVAGHFVQEDKGPELAAIVNRFVAANP